MTVKELIEKLQQIEYKDQEIFVSIDDNTGLDIIDLDESIFAAFINVHNKKNLKNA